jgi:hypothetical protein
MAPVWVFDQLQMFVQYITGFYEPFCRKFNKFFGWDTQDQFPLRWCSQALLVVLLEVNGALPLHWSVILILVASLGNPLFLIKACMQVNIL